MLPSPHTDAHTDCFPRQKSNPAERSQCSWMLNFRSQIYYLQQPLRNTQYFYNLAIQFFKISCQWDMVWECKILIPPQRKEKSQNKGGTLFKSSFFFFFYSIALTTQLWLIRYGVFSVGEEECPLHLFRHFLLFYGKRKSQRQTVKSRRMYMGWDISECHPEIITGAEDQDTFRLKVHSFLLCISCNRNTQCNNLQNVTSFFFFFFFFFGPAQLQSREHQKCLKKIIALFSVAAAKGAHIR